MSNIGAVPTTADKDEYDRYDMNAYVVFNAHGDVVAIVYDTVNNELDITPVKTASTTAAKNVTCSISGQATGQTGTTVSVAASPATAKPGATVTLTATLSAAIADKATTVVVNGDNGVGNVSIVVKAGKTSGTATFTMPKADTTFTFVSAAVAK